MPIPISLRPWTLSSDGPVLALGLTLACENEIKRDFPKFLKRFQWWHPGGREMEIFDSASVWRISGPDRFSKLGLAPQSAWTKDVVNEACKLSLGKCSPLHLYIFTISYLPLALGGGDEEKKEEEILFGHTASGIELKLPSTFHVKQSTPVDYSVVVFDIPLHWNNDLSYTKIAEFLKAGIEPPFGIIANNLMDRFSPIRIKDQEDFQKKRNNLLTHSRSRFI